MKLPNNIQEICKKTKIFFDIQANSCNFADKQEYKDNMAEILSHIGNMELLKQKKIAFLCSSKTTSRDIMRSFDWAMNVPKDSCIISGFQTKLEQDVLHILLKRHVSVIIVLARRMYKTLPAEIQEAVDLQEALVISLSNNPRNSKENAIRRNKYIIEIANNITIGALDRSSSLATLLSSSADSTQQHSFFYLSYH